MMFKAKGESLEQAAQSIKAWIETAKASANADKEKSDANGKANEAVQATAANVSMKNTASAADAGGRDGGYTDSDSDVLGTNDSTDDRSDSSEQSEGAPSTAGDTDTPEDAGDANAPKRKRVIAKTQGGKTRKTMMPMPRDENARRTRRRTRPRSQ